MSLLPSSTIPGPVRAAEGRALRRVTVVGGGVAGTLFAIHLLRHAVGPVEITVLEPRERLGEGVAYSSAEPQHITNVPAARMSADPDDAGAFTRWLARYGDAPCGDERDAYARRALFGDYLRDVLARTCAAHPLRRLVHLRRRARTVERAGDHLRIDTDMGPILADAVVLATGNLAPALPTVLAPLAASPRCIVDPWRPDFLDDVPKTARVLIVGTGLTMGDTVTTLRSGGHTGEIVALSRRGEIPRRGLAVPIAPFGDFSQPPTTARGLLRLFRSEVRRAVAAGTSWYAVLAAARGVAWSLWAALPIEERRRFRRHVLHPYELHRHVMPGPVHDVVTAERRSRSLRVVAAKLSDARCVDGALEVTFRPRGARAATLLRERFDVVINCTGPAYAELTRLDPFWASLADKGLVHRDLVGIGPAVDRHGRALDVAGDPQPDLLMVGTLARSAVGELTGVREIAMQAHGAATALQHAWCASPKRDTA